MCNNIPSAPCRERFFFQTPTPKPIRNPTSDAPKKQKKNSNHLKNTSKLDRGRGGQYVVISYNIQYILHNKQ